jgi:hypothetical protein
MINPDTVMAALIALGAFEQILAQCDSLKSNSTFQLICNLTNTLVGFFKKNP